MECVVRVILLHILSIKRLSFDCSPPMLDVITPPSVTKQVPVYFRCRGLCREAVPAPNPILGEEENDGTRYTDPVIDASLSCHLCHF